MGFRFTIEASLEGAKETIARVVNSVRDKYTKYQSWMSDAEAAAPHLTKIDDTRKINIYLFDDVVLMVKAADALTKVLQQVQRKTEVDFTKLTQVNDLKKVGIVAAPTTFDTTAYKDHSWGHPTTKNIKPLKESGWTGSKASTIAKAFAATLKNVGQLNAFENWTSSAVNEASTSKDADRSRVLNNLVKQAQQIVKIRHTVLNDIYKQYTLVKKAI